MSRAIEDDVSRTRDEGAVVDVRGLTVRLTETGDDIVHDISFTIGRGEVLALVGESGSGKSTVASALLGHCRPGARISDGSVFVAGTDLLRLSSAKLRAQRGAVVAMVPQDPSAALNPALRLKIQLRELIEVHEPAAANDEVDNRIVEALQDVRLPSDQRFLRRFPYQISGGQQQRILIAMAFMLQPALVVLDEPTTGLDAISTAHLLNLLQDVCRRRGAAVLHVTHDLTVARASADRVLVMYGGRAVELGNAQQVLSAPQHPYTARLVDAQPSVTERRRLEVIAGEPPLPGRRPSGCAFRTRCELSSEICATEEPLLRAISDVQVVACHHNVEARSAGPELLEAAAQRDSVTPVLRVTSLEVGYGRRTVLSGITFDVAPGECLAVLGESGAGKSTLGRAIAGLEASTAGTIELDGETLDPQSSRRRQPHRLAIQYVFQNPFGSLNPRKTVDQILRKVLVSARRVSPTVTEDELVDVLNRVSLASTARWRLPRELSGGERQRVAIARALLCQPRVLVCDEVTSALDVSVQAGIVELLRSLQTSIDLATVFVTHDLGVVSSLADRVVVLDRGRIVETGNSDALIGDPQADFTRRLVGAAREVTA
ncbi:dipeptide ABC transporter ATP-binding protein [Kribbella speibonae]|uniref:ABC transporter ATP-binding protein n=1 Tax=Kribbella speibonae TaxID=1572660 RepID=A0A4R0ITC7_9ACTN|nr:ABC transporter ATP-binding protein [Kribbella speibonae]TCC36459.1 ABC transporter ATP-binding protein [Kribbella speibonae]